MDSSPSQNPQIQSLIQRAAAGDGDAYARLIERVSERLMRMSHMMLRNYPRLRRWEQTDDVFQNAMIRLHRSLAEVRPESPRAFFGLAATQIRRTLIDLVRHHFGPEGEAGHYRSDAAAQIDGGVGAVNAKPSRDGRPETLDDWAAFHEAVERLPDEEREVFDMTWYGGLQQSEIAELLGVSVPTVQRRWQRARMHVYETLEGKSPE